MGTLMDADELEVLQAILENQQETFDEQNRKIDRLSSYAQEQHKAARACQEAVEKLTRNYQDIEQKADEALSEALESRLSAVERRIDKIATKPTNDAQKAAESARRTVKWCSILLVLLALCALVMAFGCWYWTQQCIGQLEAANEAFAAAVQMAQEVEVELTPPETVAVNPISDFFNAVYTVLMVVVAVMFVVLVVSLVKGRKHWR